MAEFDGLRTLLTQRGLPEEDVLNKLKGLVTNIQWTAADTVVLFEALLERFKSTGEDRSHLLSWMMEMLHCIEINYITHSWSKNKQTLIDLVREQNMTCKELKELLANDKEKNLDEILEEIRQEKLNQVDDELLAQVKDIVSSVASIIYDSTSHGDAEQLSGLKKVLLRLCRAVEAVEVVVAGKKTHITPRLTQMVSWCIMALSKTGRLIQVGTGEGKSCIVAMFAAFQAMNGKNVDIMSSSSVLAQRDLEDWRQFYEYLNISVDSNIHKQEEGLKRCYQQQVVYGTVEEFAGDWLKQHFERMDIFGQRTFQCAIVDEVDSLMLDKGLHSVYLGNDLPALKHLNPLLAFIWTTVNEYHKIGTDATTVGRRYPFHKVVLDNLKGKDVDEFTLLQMAEDAGVLAKGSVKDLRKNRSLLTEKTGNITATQLAKFFQAVEKRFPHCKFALHFVNGGSIQKLNKPTDEESVPLLLTNGGFCQYMYPDKESVLQAATAEISRVLQFTPCELSKDETTCYVPGFLSNLVNSRLKVWIENAFKAQTMKKDADYVIEKHGVVPVDFSCTGVIENFLVLDDGLQQFIEMKHGSKLSDMAIITNFLSNVGLFQKYGQQIFGISGTLGQQAETKTLQEVYGGLQTCKIPLFKRRKLFEVEGVIVDDEEEWIKTTCDVITTQINPTPYRGPRAVLVICETIQRAKVLHQVLGGKVPNKRLYISNNMDNAAIFARPLEAGEVVIATNLAGRGADFKVFNQVKEAGGLFVVPTFLPSNARVEAQAFGRTARQGSPGSAQLIICTKHLSSMLPKTLTEISKLGLKTIKNIRDYIVDEGLARYLEHDIPRIKNKEKLLSQYLKTLDEVYKSSKTKPAQSYLSALNEFNAMWLHTKFNETESIKTLEHNLQKDLNAAREKLRQTESPSANLHHYTAFGNELRGESDVEKCIKMYTKAIQADSTWAAIAYYNRAFASLTQQNGRQDQQCLSQAVKDLQSALKSIELYSQQIEVTQRYARQQTDGSRLNRHMQERRNVLRDFKENINEAVKKVEEAIRFRETFKVIELPVEFLNMGGCIVPLCLSLPDILSKDPLTFLQLMKHADFDVFNELCGLKSLGLTHIYILGILQTFGSKIRRFFS